jgi:MoaA/NifB/PqqE/SkfB family radical SAM enzyme
MCGLYGDTSKGRDFDRNLFDQKVVPLLPYAKVIQLQGLGEPLLSKNFDHFYRTAIEYGVRPSFVTNGTQLNEERIRRFVGDGVILCVSLDGLTEETLTRFRPQAKIEKLIHDLNFIGKISRENPNSGLRLILSCILSRFNLHEFPALMDYAHEWNVQIITINELILLPQSPESIQDGPLTDQDIQENTSLIELGKLKAKEYGIELLLPKRFGGIASTLMFPGFLNSKVDKKKRDIGQYPGTCLSPWKEIMILANGDVRLCCNSMKVIGNLYTDDFDSIWNGEECKAYRRTVNSSIPPRECDLCPSYTGINLGSPKFLNDQIPLRAQSKSFNLVKQ